MNYHSDHWIMDRVQEHYNEALESFPKDRIVGIFYQGSGNYGLDGEMTSASMYVDMVKREFARNSCAVDRYPIMDDIKDMFNFLRGRNGLD